jgi:rhodanese-related sulfurtransferase
MKQNFNYGDENMNKVNKDKAIKLVQKGAKLIDIRSPVAFRDGSIPGAINMPFKNFLNFLIGMKPNDKVIIFSERYSDQDVKDVLKYATQLNKSNSIFISTYRDLV